MKDQLPNAEQAARLMVAIGLAGISLKELSRSLKEAQPAFEEASRMWRKTILHRMSAMRRKHGVLVILRKEWWTLASMV